MDQKAYIIDGIKWYVNKSGTRRPQPLCPRHYLRLKPAMLYRQDWNEDCMGLKCEECKEIYELPRYYQDEVQYVLDKIDAKTFKNLSYINIDNEAIPIAEEKISKDSKYFVTSLLTESKIGMRLVVYVGEKGKKEKTQIFVEPDIKRLAFDQKDLHPTEVFTSLEAIFNDGTKAKIEEKEVEE